MAGNGDGKIEIGYTPFAEGWVMIEASAKSGTARSQIPSTLNEAVIAWLKNRPNIRLRTTLPIVQDGCTVAVHLWFKV